MVLARRAGRARSTKYVVKKNKQSSFSSHWMRWGGATLLLFIIWHLLNFSFGKINVDTGKTGDAAGDPYTLMVDSFSVWWLTVIYLLRHGRARAAPAPRHLQRRPDPGLHQQRQGQAQRQGDGYMLAVVVAGGFSLVPIGVLAGVID